MDFKNINLDENLNSKNKRENVTNFLPKLIDLSWTTSNLSLNQLWELIKQEAPHFETNFQAWHKAGIKAVNKYDKFYLKRGAEKHRLTTKDKLAILWAIIIEKHSAKKIASEFNISASLVYSVFRSYKKDGISKLLEKTKEKTLENN